jgi:predicted secreted protein
MTAVEFLITEIEKTDWWLIRKKIPLLIEQAKEMEKEQIIEAFNEGNRTVITTATEYYERTFKPE